MPVTSDIEGNLSTSESRGRKYSRELMNSDGGLLSRSGEMEGVVVSISKLFPSTVDDGDPLPGVRERVEICHHHLEVFLKYNHEIFDMVKRRVTAEADYHKGLIKTYRACYDAVTEIKREHKDRESAPFNSRLIQEFYAPIDAWRRTTHEAGRGYMNIMKQLGTMNDLVEDSIFKLQEMDHLRKVIRSQWEKKIKEYMKLDQEKKKSTVKYERLKDEYNTIRGKPQYVNSSKLNSLSKSLGSIEKQHIKVLTEYNKFVQDFFQIDAPGFLDNYLKAFVGLEALNRFVLDSVQDFDRSHEHMAKQLFRSSKYTQAKISYGMQGLEQLIFVCKETIPVPTVPVFRSVFDASIVIKPPFYNSTEGDSANVSKSKSIEVKHEGANLPTTTEEQSVDITVNFTDPGTLTEKGILADQTYSILSMSSYASSIVQDPPAIEDHYYGHSFSRSDSTINQKTKEENIELYDPEPIMKSFSCLDSRTVPYIYQLCFAYIKQFSHLSLQSEEPLFYLDPFDSTHSAEGSSKAPVSVVISESDRLLSLYLKNSNRDSVELIQQGLNTDGSSLRIVARLLYLLLKQDQKWISPSAGHYLHDTFKSAYQLSKQQITQRLRFFASFLTKEQQVFMYILLDVLMSITTVRVPGDDLDPSAHASVPSSPVSSPPPLECNDQLDPCARAIGSALFQQMPQNISTFAMQQLILYSRSISASLGATTSK